jgi:hypothetical protein
MNSQELIESLAHELDIDADGVAQSEWNPNLFIVGKQEYLVYETENEAEEAAVEQMKNLLETEGISFLNWGYMCTDISNFVDVDWFDTAKRENYEAYVEDIADEWEDDDRTRLEHEMEDAGCETEEEYVDYLCEGCPDSVEWFRSNFGESELDQIAINHPEVVDLDKLAQYVVDTDGIGSTLARYDGKEIELYEGGYAYRVS